MEKVTITIKTEDDAFYPDPAPELSKILRELAKGLEVSHLPSIIQDTNGNTVGKVEVE